MKSLIALVSLLLALRSIAAGVEGQSPITMHRLQAGTVNADGWYFAQSTDGDFSVSFPIKFNDSTIRVIERDGRVVTGYVLGSKDKDGVVFGAAEVPLNSRKMTGREVLESRRAKGIVQEDHTRIFAFAGGRAFEWLEQNSERGNYVRMIDFPGFSIILSITFPAVAVERAENCKIRFFDSLRFKEQK